MPLRFTCNVLAFGLKRKGVEGETQRHFLHGNPLPWNVFFSQ